MNRGSWRPGGFGDYDLTLAHFQSVTLADAGGAARYEDLLVVLGADRLEVSLLPPGGIR